MAFGQGEIFIVLYKLLFKVLVFVARYLLKIKRKKRRNLKSDIHKNFRLISHDVYTVIRNQIFR